VSVFAAEFDMKYANKLLEYFRGYIYSRSLMARASDSPTSEGSYKNMEAKCGSGGTGPWSRFPLYFRNEYRRKLSQCLSEWRLCWWTIAKRM
jgi:hypothetical protein